MFIAMADDLRVIFIKLADRLHNMQTLLSHPKPEKRERIALETLNIYVPIAARLGLYKMKTDLEEECFKILHPKERKLLTQQLARIAQGREEFQNTAIITIGDILSKHDISHKVAFRIKSPYSIYKKMQRKNIENPEDLYDIYGIRIAVPTVADCYRVL
jgi:GTP pyrophosphokinase